MSGAWRYWTDCATGIRHWRWFSRVGRPERSIVYPCAKAAVVAAPLLGVPGAAILPAAPGPFPLPPVSAPPVPASGLFGGWGGGGFDLPDIPAQGGIEYAVSAGPTPVPLAPIWPDIVTPRAPFVPPSAVTVPETPVATPEPSSLAVLALGALLAVVRRGRA